MTADDAEALVNKLKATRANMLGTDDEQHYWDCHEAAALIRRQQEQLAQARKLLIQSSDMLGNYWFDGSYNNDDVIELNKRVDAYLEQVAPPDSSLPTEPKS